MRDKGERPLNPELMKEYLLTAFPNPGRRGCPGSEVLQGLAERELSLSDPAMHHVASCSECYREYLNYRLDREQDQAHPLRASAEPSSNSAARAVMVPLPAKHRGRTPLLAIAASVAIALTGVVGYTHLHHGAQPVQVASAAPVDASVNLFEAATLRGVDDDPNPLQQVSLPATVVRLSVVLPRFSEAGKYTILVSKDRGGKQVVAQASGPTGESQGRVVVHVTLNLRGATPGTYFLATVRGSDNGTYYYPLKVQ